MQVKVKRILYLYSLLFRYLFTYCIPSVIFRNKKKILDISFLCIVYNMVNRILLNFSFNQDDQLDGKIVHLGTIEKTTWCMRPNWKHSKVTSVEIVRNNNTNDAEFVIVFTNSSRNFKGALVDGEKSVVVPTPFYDNFYTGHGLKGYLAIYVDDSMFTKETKKEVTKNEPTVIDSPIANTFPQLSDDLLSLLYNPDSFTDTILKCGSEEIAVHKVILSARSSVFSTMFKTRMQEGCGGSANIVDITPDVLHVMLKYIYCGKIDNLTVLLADDLLFAADKYQLEELKMICIDKLKASLTRENLFRSLVLGDLHDQSLKEHAMKFICQFTQFSTIENTQEWKTLVADRPGLAIEVLAFVVKYREQN